MVKKPEKSNLSQDLLKGLQGFEEVFEDYVESEEYKDNERRENETSRAQEQYELQYFLEQENARLTNLEIFLAKKIPLKKNFPQDEKLFLLQATRKKILKEKLTQELAREESAFKKNLIQIFNSHFNQGH